MIISDGVDNYNIDELNLNYVKLVDDVLSFYRTNNTSENIEITDVNDMTAAIDVLLRRMHTKLATTGAGSTGTSSSGIIYWINCKLADSVDREDETITVEFISGDPLVIEYENSAEAEKEYEYIDFCYKNADLDRFMTGKRILKVNPMYDTNIGSDAYSTYTEAKEQADSGDVILFERCEYVRGTERFDLKDGVDIVFSDTRVIVNKRINWQVPTHSASPPTRIKPLISDSEEAVTCYVLGTARISFNIPNLAGWLCSDIVRSGSKFFMAYHTLEFITLPVGVSSWHHAYGNTRTWIKGIRAADSRLYDDDEDNANNYPDSCDYDVLYANTSDEAEGHIYLPYSNNCNWRIRNGYLKGELTTTYCEGNGFYFVNCKFENSGIALHGVDNEYYKQWRCLWKVAGEAVGGGDGIVEVENYNQSYSKGTSPATNNTESSPAMIVNAGLIIEPILIDDPIGAVQTLTGEQDGDDLILTLPHIENAEQIEIYRDNVLFETRNVIFGEDLNYTIEDSSAHYYQVRGKNSSGYTNFSNLIGNIMALTNKPIKSKYTIDDELFYWNGSSIVAVTVIGVSVEVDNPLNDVTGRQVNKYLTDVSAELISESSLFASKNSLLAVIKGAYINVGDSNYLVGQDGFSFDPSFSDAGGLNLEGIDVDAAAMPIADVVFDGATLENATMPANADTKAEFKALVKSYDKDTTLWTDGDPIGI